MNELKTSLVLKFSLQNSLQSFESVILIWYKIIEKVNSKFDLKSKEALHINWRIPNLHAQQNHLALTLSLTLHN